MGGRGALRGNGVPEDDRRWRENPLSLKGVNEIDGVKIIHNTDTSNARIPPVSNTPDTRYIIADRQGEIRYIAEYRNNKIVFSIDINYLKGIHGHVWNTEIERRRHDPNNAYRVPERYMKLLNACMEYNHKHFGKPKEGKMGGDRDLDIEALLRKRKNESE